MAESFNIGHTTTEMYNHTYDFAKKTLKHTNKPTNKHTKRQSNLQTNSIKDTNKNTNCTDLQRILKTSIKTSNFNNFKLLLAYNNKTNSIFVPLLSTVLTYHCFDPDFKSCNQLGGSCLSCRCLIGSRGWVNTSDSRLSKSSWNVSALQHGNRFHEDLCNIASFMKASSHHASGTTFDHWSVIRLWCSVSEIRTDPWTVPCFIRPFNPKLDDFRVSISDLGPPDLQNFYSRISSQLSQRFSLIATFLLHYFIIKLRFVVFVILNK